MGARAANRITFDVQLRGLRIRDYGLGISGSGFRVQCSEFDCFFSASGLGVGGGGGGGVARFSVWGFRDLGFRFKRWGV